ncbi:GTP-binding protein Rho1, variant 3 [Metarhizium acridum]|nr:GTP-binding protein Rho1, variant 3 [Metarhizium acridum]
MKEGKSAYRKLVIVGDGGCGKTCLLTVFCRGVFPEAYIPTVFESHVQQFQVDDTSVELALWDTAGQEDYDRFRIHSYPNADIILVCFALNNAFSLSNVVDKWHREVCQYCPDVPIILVGCKQDLRNQQYSSNITSNLAQTSTFTTPKKIEKIRKMLKAVAYLECSALSGEGVQKVFEVAATCAIQHQDRPARKKDKCIIL